MALNRAQLLVHSDEALAQFCIDHRILNDVVIERPGPNDDADWVEGEGNRIAIRTWIIHQARLRFPLSKLLRTVLSLCGLTLMQVSVNFVRTVLAVEALMQREGLEFTAKDLLHVYCVVKPRKNPETQMLEGNHYLCLRKPNQPQTRLVTDSPDKDQYLNDFIWVSGQWEFPTSEPDTFSVPRHKGYVPIGFNGRFWRRSDRCSAAISAVNNCRRSRKVSDLLGYAPLYRYTIPLRATRQGHPVLPPLQVHGQGPRPRCSLSNEVSDLFKGTSAELRRLLEEAEGESSDSSESSSSNLDVDLGDERLDEEAKVEDGKEVDQVPIAAPLVPVPLVLVSNPINLPSSDSDIVIVEPREVVEHSYSHSGSSSSGSQGNEETMAPKVRILGKRQAPRIKLAMPPEAPDSSMLVPVEDQSATGPPELWTPQFTAVELGKHVTSADTSRDHETCVALGNAVMLPQDVANHAVETTVEFGGKLVMVGAQVSTLVLRVPHLDARSAAEIATLQWNQAQQETLDLKAFACGEVYKKLFDCAFERARDVYERQLAELRPGVFQEGWLAYFNEEEYATLPADEGNVNIAVVEARAGVEGTVDGDRAGEAEGLSWGSRGMTFLESLHSVDSSSARFISTLPIPMRPYLGFGEHIPTSFKQSLPRAVVYSQQMSLSSSLLRLPFLEDLCKFWGIKMPVVYKIRILDLDRCSARAGGLVELASPSPSAFAEYQSLVGTLPYLEATIHKAAVLLVVLDDRSVVPLSFRMKG
ncbi:hypothetical protein Acr_12g0000780 [Actinidia rufa]|uniref:Uncharacterized protein n=1 Tax=Actinidia rufa TaxID=165716 RepID=A0A7J0FI16_9ERIC|nr:hypothetical protein Acr_12g0000780 [Actinidia rufa]